MVFWQHGKYSYGVWQWFALNSIFFNTESKSRSMNNCFQWLDSELNSVLFYYIRQSVALHVKSIILISINMAPGGEKPPLLLHGVQGTTSASSLDVQVVKVLVFVLTKLT